MESNMNYSMCLLLWAQHPVNCAFSLVCQQFPNWICSHNGHHSQKNYAFCCFHLSWTVFHDNDLLKVAPNGSKRHSFLRSSTLIQTTYNITLRLVACLQNTHHWCCTHGNNASSPPNSDILERANSFNAQALLSSSCIITLKFARKTTCNKWCSPNW